MAEPERGTALGLGLLALAALVGGVFALDLGGIATRLTDSPKATMDAPLLKLAQRPSPAPIAGLTQAWFIGAPGYDGAELERQSARASMVIYFRKERCDECKRFERDVLGSGEAKAFLAGVVKVRVDPQAGEREAKLAQRFGVDAVPAVVVIGEKGPPRKLPLLRTERDRAVVALSATQFVAYCK